MKTIAVALLAVSLGAQANTVPTRDVSEVQVSNNHIIFVTPKTDYKVTHDCQLYLSEKSSVQIRPRSSRSLSVTNSLVITVDGNKRVCDIEQIEEMVT